MQCLQLHLVHFFQLSPQTHLLPRPHHPFVYLHMTVKRAFHMMEPEHGVSKRPRTSAPTGMGGGVFVGKRKRDARGEEVVAHEFDFKRLAISPRNKAAPDAAGMGMGTGSDLNEYDYTFKNRQLRECHYLREQRKHQAAVRQRQLQDAAAQVQGPQVYSSPSSSN